MLHKLSVIGVMGSGTESHEALAIATGHALATLDIHLLNGGGSGVMTTVSKGFVETPHRKGLCIGIIPTEKQENGLFEAKSGYPNPYIEIPIFTPLGTYGGVGTDTISRNFINIMTANIIIALPGSGGTLNEINIAVKYAKPLCLLGQHDLPSDLYPHIPRFEMVDDAINWVKTELTKVTA